MVAVNVLAAFALCQRLLSFLSGRNLYLILWTRIITIYLTLSYFDYPRNEFRLFFLDCAGLRSGPSSRTI